MNSNLWNVRPGLTPKEFDESLQRLDVAGLIVRDGSRWRLAQHVARQQASSAPATS